MHIERILLQDVGPFTEATTIKLPPGTRDDLADVYLLTGPNGTGKSTILYALASTIGCGMEHLLKDDLLVPRMRSAKSMVALSTADQRTFLSGDPDLFNASTASNPFSSRALFFRGNSPHLCYWASDETAPRYPELTAAYERRRFTWTAFAYSGTRLVSDVRITAIQEPKESPFKNSLSFQETADTNVLAHWIVNQNYRRLKAKEDGDAEEAERRDKSLRRIEQAIADIIDEPGFGFDTSGKHDDDVRVRWRGTTIRLGVLPGGLQSIVSWVADLLMRLDRIPWENDTPVLERSFLLLLDEIDIHLHPAWQRRVLPFVQRLFPRAQIIASTHSPLVVSSAAAGWVISLGLRGESATVVSNEKASRGASYATVLGTTFGIDPDLDTERKV